MVGCAGGAGCAVEDGQPGLEGVLHEAEHQVHTTRPRGAGSRPSANTGTLSIAAG